MTGPPRWTGRSPFCTTGTPAGVGVACGEVPGVALGEGAGVESELEEVSPAACRQSPDQLVAATTAKAVSTPRANPATSTWRLLIANGTAESGPSYGCACYVNKRLTSTPLLTRGQRTKKKVAPSPTAPSAHVFPP